MQHVFVTTVPYPFARNGCGARGAIEITTAPARDHMYSWEGIQPSTCGAHLSSLARSVERSKPLG
jgi:hypothetical protein